jgi:competence CoiA-like predicted nuclease
MSEIIRLCAINKLSGEYTTPRCANKKYEYICVDCRKDVIIRQGKIKAHHFAHRKKEISCKFYDQPTDTQIHKYAILLLKYVLDNKIQLSIIQKCKM